MCDPNSSPVPDLHHDDDVIDRTFRIVLWIAGLFVLSLAAHQAHAAETCLAMIYTPHTATVNQGVDQVVSADLDRDGDVDVMVPEGVTNSVRRLANLGNDAFAASEIGVGGAAERLAIGDVDHDGDLDVLVAMPTAMRLLRGDGTGKFSLGPMLPYAPTDDTSTGAYLADVNADGHLDAVVVVSHAYFGPVWSGGAIVALGDGTGQFTLLPTHALPITAGHSVLVDLDRDGDLDLAVMGTTIALAFGNGDGTLVNGTSLFPAGMYPGAFGAGDFDGDGDVDLVRGNKYSYGTLRNDGTGVFTSGTTFNIGSYGKGVAVGDVDHDGDLDLAATSGGGSALRIVLNDGFGNFTPANSIAVSIQCYAVLLFDSNGDGTLDPWAIDVTTGELFRGTSHCVAATYGVAKTNSLGCAPTMGIVGSPSIASSNFAIATANELESQPALMLLGLAAGDFTALAGHVLVAPPFAAIASTTSSGSGNPQACDGTLALAIPGASLGLVPVGSKIFAQVIAADPWIGDLSGASLSNGLWFEILP